VKRSRSFFPKVSRSFFSVFFAAALSVFSLSCGGTPPGYTLVREFKFIGKDQAEPSKFLFQIEWLDNESDLIVRGGDGSITPGKFLFYVQDMDKMDAPKEVQFVITEAMIPPGSREGIIQNIGIALNADKYPSKIKFSVVMVDIQNHRSNQPSLILQAKSQ